MTPPEQELQSLSEELERLKSEQDKAMSLSVYVGMTKEEAKRHDERRKRIYELYETPFVSKGPSNPLLDTTDFIQMSQSDFHQSPPPV